MNAIPTEYGGTRFRSRLEARWAAFFDLLGWPWEYEPIDLDGYIPDFLVLHLRVLVEVKPALALSDFAEAQLKIEYSGWHGFALCVGATLDRVGMTDRVLLGAAWNNCRPGDWVPFSLPGAEKRIAAWREAGNRVQWSAP